MTQISLPRGSSETGTNEWSDVYSNDNAITTVVNGQLSNDNLDSSAAIAHSKLANGTAGQLLIANASGVVTATSVSGDIASVSGAGAITIANSAITTAKINDAAVTTAKLADSSVTSAKIVDGTIATADIADNAVTADKLPTADASSLGLNTTAVSSRRGKATNATERTTTTTLAIPSLSFTLTLPSVGFVLYGLKADLKGSTSGTTARLSVTQDTFTTATNYLTIESTGTTYTTKSYAAMTAASDFNAGASSVSVGALLVIAGSAGTAYAKNITVWAAAIEVA